MLSLARNYLVDLVNQVGSGWNRFWFTPSAPQTLSMLRVLSGALALYYVASFGADLVAFFGPGGLIPVDTVLMWTNDFVTRYSYLDSIETAGSLRAAHYTGLVVVGLFTIGFFTRVTSILSLIVLLSYMHRAPMLVTEAEPVLAMLMLYLCISPAGAYFSVDAWLRRRKAFQADPTSEPPAPAKSTLATIATRLIQIHLAAIFIASGLAMLSTQTWWAGDAVWWIIARPRSGGFWLTSSLSRMPLVFQFLTHVIVAYHLLFPLLVWNRLARPLVLAAGLLIWPLVAVISGLYLYAAVMLAGTCIYISPAVVALLEKRREDMPEPQKVDTIHKPTAPSQRATVRV